MLNILCVVDKEKTAIDRLAQGTKKYLKNCEFNILAVHPKRPDDTQLERFQHLAGLADVIDYQYFRTAEMLREKFEWVKDKPSILTHNNPYSITESDWNSYQCNVANNLDIYEKLQKITTTRVEHIQLAADPYFWAFNENWKPSKRVTMVANRIEAKKGILPVAQACSELGLTMMLVGSISDMRYFNEVMATGNVVFAQDISDEQLREVYYDTGLHICNSEDNFESGTLPILESIFCGTPVLSRLVGHVPEFKEGVIIGNYLPGEVDKLTKTIDDALNDKKALEKLRHKAWFEIKDKTFERRAYLYSRLYRELLGHL